MCTVIVLPGEECGPGAPARESPSFVPPSGASSQNFLPPFEPSRRTKTGLTAGSILQQQKKV